MVLPDESWMRRGHCVRADNPDAWHPSSGASPETLHAIRICRTCPVQRECLAYAMRSASIYGVWGGTTWIQRDQIRRTAADESDYQAVYELMVEQMADACPWWETSDTTEAILDRRTSLTGKPHLARRPPVRKPTLL